MLKWIVVCRNKFVSVKLIITENCYQLNESIKYWLNRTKLWNKNLSSKIPRYNFKNVDVLIDL